MVRAALFVILVLSSLTTSCKRSPDRQDGEATSRSSAGDPRVFQVKGVVTALDPNKKSIEIRHEAVPGYMPAMTMPFSVKASEELAGLAPGQAVLFRLSVTDTEAWIDQIRRVESSAANGPPADSQIRLAREVEPLQEGDPLPDYHLTDQSGQPLNPAQFKGQALAITFLFTRCPLPTYCPLIANQFVDAQRKLLGMSKAPTNWHLLTISFDPGFDTPAVLKAYAQAHNYNPKHWSFATGELIEVTALGEQFGLAFWHDQNGGISHNLRTAIVDASGRVQKIFQGNTWTSDELVAEMAWAAGWTNNPSQDGPKRPGVLGDQPNNK
jgi:protein SCO1/2